MAAPPPPTGTNAIPEVRIHEENTPIGDYLYSHAGSVYQALLMFSFIPFLVYFMLSWRDHINRSFLQFFHGEDRVVAARSVQGIADMVRAFVVGNFVLGLLLAYHFERPVLADARAIPDAGGSAERLHEPGAICRSSPGDDRAAAGRLPLNAFSVYVLIVVTVGLLHLIALNLLYPKIVGSRVHLNPLVVTFSLMLWGFLWDAPGLVLAIPLTAGLKAVCDNVKGLRPFGKFLGD